MNYFTTPIESRKSPLPPLDWADSEEVWRTMLRKELNYVRDQNMFDKHPALHARMRAILLDWLIEVSICELYVCNYNQSKKNFIFHNFIIYRK